MKITHISYLAFALAFAHAPLSFAESNYYLELGNQGSANEAMGQWNSLQSANPDILGNLQFHPETILLPGNETATRIHAGPVNSKASAEKLCSQLFSRNIACFVLEGHVESASAASSTAGTPAQQPVVLPWLAHPAAVAAQPHAPAEDSEHGMFSWLFGHGNQAENSTVPASPPITQADVDVAEAIHVPLSGDQTETSTPAFTAVQVGTQHAAPSASQYDNVGWLNVDAFENEEVAAEFWQNVRSMVPARAAGLRVRIVRPLLMRAQAGITVNIGPFVSMDDANSFCRDGVISVDRGLRCSFIPGEPARIANAPELRYQPDRDYNARRQMLLQRQHGSISYQNTLTPAPSTQTRQFWVQVATAASQMAAMQNWQAIQSANADILNGLNSRISTALTGKTYYTVKVGPLRSNADAFSLCSTLQQRKIDCKVFASM